MKPHLFLLFSIMWFQIGNKVGGINGWIMMGSIYGICTAVQL
jgi:hypothetical protein